MTRNIRQVTKSVNPKELAVWPLKPFMERLWEYLYEIYDTNVHPALGKARKMPMIMDSKIAALVFIG